MRTFTTSILLLWLSSRDGPAEAASREALSLAQRTWSATAAAAAAATTTITRHANDENIARRSLHRRTKTVLDLRGGASKRDGPKSKALEGTTSMTASMFNLVNNVAGAGILALSAGQAAGTGWIPAIAICSILGAMSSRTFVMVGESCEMLGEKDFKGLWKRTVGEKSVFVVDAIIAMLCTSVCIVYTGILGDVSTFLLAQTPFPTKWNKRTTNILFTTITFLFPMSLIKDLSVLAFTSILGFSAVMYTVVLIVGRALDGSYKIGSGKFLVDGAIKAMPSFEKQSLWNMDFTSLVLTSILGLAFVSHYNAPNFYRQLERTSAKRFGHLVYSSFVFLVLLYVVTMCAGYSTFGESCLGNILLNYHPNDILATFGRVATWFSILFGFPLVATGAREGLIGAFSSLGYPEIGQDKHNFALVLSMLIFTTTISCTVEDVSLVLGLAGAMFGSFITYICPTLIYCRAVKISKGKESPEYKQAKLNYVLVPFGVFVGAFGAYVTLRQA